jgi:hypothetical protein
MSSSADATLHLRYFAFLDCPASSCAPQLHSIAFLCWIGLRPIMPLRSYAGLGLRPMLLRECTTWETQPTRQRQKRARARNTPLADSEKESHARTSHIHRAESHPMSA